MPRFELYPAAFDTGAGVINGTGYRVIRDDGSLALEQPFAPSVPGYQPMTDAEATAAAQADIASGTGATPT